MSEKIGYSEIVLISQLMVIDGSIYVTYDIEYSIFDFSR